jgi:hypothetical protein
MKKITITFLALALSLTGNAQNGAPLNDQNRNGPETGTVIPSTDSEINRVDDVAPPDDAWMDRQRMESSEQVGEDVEVIDTNKPNGVMDQNTDWINNVDDVQE